MHVSTLQSSLARGCLGGFPAVAAVAAVAVAVAVAAVLLAAAAALFDACGALAMVLKKRRFKFVC